MQPNYRDHKYDRQVKPGRHAEHYQRERGTRHPPRDFHPRDVHPHERMAMKASHSHRPSHLPMQHSDRMHSAHESHRQSYSPMPSPVPDRHPRQHHQPHSEPPRRQVASRGRTMPLRCQQEQEPVFPHYPSYPSHPPPSGFKPSYTRGAMVPLHREYHPENGYDYSVIEQPPMPRKHRHKIKRQRAGCCGCCNSCFCGGGCCDRPEVINGRPGGFRPGGPCKSLNIKGCCDRERIFVRRGSSVHSWHIMNLDDSGREAFDQPGRPKSNRGGCC